MTILYKYLSPDRIGVLETQMIRLTQPGDLNDPIEALPRFTKIRDDSWLQFVADASQLFSSLKLKEGNFTDFLNWLTPSRRPIIQRRILQMVMDMGTGIFSMSTSRSIELMWAHYASSHQGFVVGFDASHRYFARKDGQILGPVKYKKHLRPFKHFQDLNAQSLFFTKSLSWAYEREWRLVKPIATKKRFTKGSLRKTKSGYDIWLERVPAGAFHSVTIGAMMPVKLRIRLLDALIKPRFKHLKVYEARLNKSGRLYFKSL
jgi:hypothetical protein